MDRPGNITEIKRRVEGIVTNSARMLFPQSDPGDREVIAPKRDRHPGRMVLVDLERLK